MAIKHTPIIQGNILKFAAPDAAGVCLEACRRWVKQVIAGKWSYGNTVYDIMDPAGIQELLAVHNLAKTMGDNTMKGYDNTITARTGGGLLSKFEGLRTRLDVINTVMSVPGAYIYNATAKDAGGHAFAFNSIGSALAFFDPNQGEWSFDGEGADAIRAWWSDFWEGKAKSSGINYKQHFHKGDRQLWRFEAQKWARARV
jgi:hypothetical protein